MLVEAGSEERYHGNGLSSRGVFLDRGSVVSLREEEARGGEGGAGDLGRERGSNGGLEERFNPKRRSRMR